MHTFDVGSLELIGAMVYSEPLALRPASTCCLPACSTSVHREVPQRPQWTSSSSSQGSKVEAVWDLTRTGRWEPVSVTGSHFLSCKNQWSLLLTEPQRLAYIDKHANPINSDSLPLPGPYSVRLGFFCQQSHSDCPTLQGGQANHISHNPPGS